MKITTKTQLALNHLRTGVIAHPTDTIYGLACLANNLDSIKTLAVLKRRDIKKALYCWPLILIIYCPILIQI